METISTRLAATGKYETPMTGTVPGGKVNKNVNSGLQIFAAYGVFSPKVNAPAVKPNLAQPKVKGIAPKPRPKVVPNNVGGGGTNAIGSATGGAGSGKIK